MTNSIQPADQDDPDACRKYVLCAEVSPRRYEPVEMPCACNEGFDEEKNRCVVGAACLNDVPKPWCQKFLDAEISLSPYSLTADNDNDNSGDDSSDDSSDNSSDGNSSDSSDEKDQNVDASSSIDNSESSNGNDDVNDNLNGYNDGDDWRSHLYRRSVQFVPLMIDNSDDNVLNGKVDENVVNGNKNDNSDVSQLVPEDPKIAERRNFFRLIIDWIINITIGQPRQPIN